MSSNENEKQYLFDNPQNLKRLLRGFYGICIALFALDLIDLVMHLTHTGHLRASGAVGQADAQGPDEGGGLL